MKIPLITRELNRITNTSIKMAELRAVLQQLEPPLERALREVNEHENVPGFMRGSKWVVSQAVSLRMVCHDVERLMAERGIPAKERVGTRVFYRPEGPARHYKRGQVASTEVRMERGPAGSWYVIEIARTRVLPGAREIRFIYLPHEAYRTALRNAMGPFSERTS